MNQLGKQLTPFIPTVQTAVRGTQRGYGSKPLNIALLTVF